MNVSIVETNTGKCVHTYKLHVHISGTQNAKHDYENAAWQCAVEDKIVNDNDRVKYSFVLGNEEG